MNRLFFAAALSLLLGSGANAQIATTTALVGTAASYEGLRQIRQSALVGTLITPKMWAGDFSETTTPDIQFGLKLVF